MTSDVFVMIGKPGHGKTFIADKLSEMLSAVHLETDQIRNEITEKPTYSTAETRDVYEKLLSRASEQIQQNNITILDEIFIAKGVQRKTLDLNTENITYILVTCDRDIAKERLDKDGIDPNIYDQFHLSLLDSIDPIRIETTGSKKQTIQQIQKKIL